MAVQLVQRRFRQGLGVLVELGSQLKEKVVGQQGNVFQPLRQGRDVNRQNIDPVVKILAKELIFHQLFQIAVGGGDNPGVHRDLL